MTMVFDVENVRDHQKKDGTIVKRAILRADSMEKFFHYDCKLGEDDYIRANKKIKVNVYDVNTNYSDTIAIQQGKLMTETK